MPKTCIKCGAEKPLSEYYSKSNKCKCCTKAAVRANRAAKLDTEDYIRYRKAAGSG